MMETVVIAGFGGMAPTAMYYLVVADIQGSGATACAITTTRATAVTGVTAVTRPPGVTAAMAVTATA
jgi:hypothetical protein